MNSQTATTMAALAAVVFVLAISPLAAAMTQTTSSLGRTSGELQQSTDTATTTQNASSCTPDGTPQLQRATLRPDDSVIEQDSPGRLTGTIGLDSDATCPMRVFITLQIPSGMYIGETDAFSGSETEIPTTTLTVQPGTTRTVGAAVYGTETGQQRIMADITYYPVGHEDMARDIDGLSLTFTVEEAVSFQQDQSASGESDGVGILSSMPQWVFGIVTAAIVGLLAVLARWTGLTGRE
jgi:hypothetical protein